MGKQTGKGLEPSNKSTSSFINVIFILIVIVGGVIGIKLSPLYGVWLGIVLTIFFLCIAAINNSFGHKTIISIGIVMGVLVALLNYFNLKGIKEDMLMPIIPIIIALIIYSYKAIKKTGNIEAIRKVKVAMVVGIPSCIIMFALMLYASVFL